MIGYLIPSPPHCDKDCILVWFRRKLEFLWLRYNGVLVFLNQRLKWLIMGNLKFWVQETKPRIFETFKSPELRPSLLSRFWPPHRETEGIIPLLQITNETYWLQKSSSHLPLKTFRFENEKDYKEEYSPEIDTPEGFISFFFFLFLTRKVNRVIFIERGWALTRSQDDTTFNIW